MKPIYKKAITILLIIAVVFALVWIYVFRQSKPSVSSQKPDYKLEASELLESFETSEMAANKIYLGKIILVSGPIQSVSEDSAGITVYLQEPGALSGVICSFNKSAIDTTKVSIGKSVKIKGICTGYLMDVVLNKCSLEPEPGHKSDL